MTADTTPAAVDSDELRRRVEDVITDYLAQVDEADEDLDPGDLADNVTRVVEQVLACAGVPTGEGATR